MTVVQRYHKLRTMLQHSITRKLLVVVFSIYLILTITVTLIQMNFEYKMAKKQTVQALQNIQDMTQASISQAIWEFNEPQIDSILHGIYINKFLVGLKLEIAQNSAIPDFESKELGLIDDKDGNIVYINPETKQSSPSTASFERLIPYYFDVYHVDTQQVKQIIGKMYLYSSNKIVFDQVKESYLLLIINAIIKTFALWVFFLWAGYKYISKPLKQLTDAIHKLSAGNWDTDLKMQVKNNKDKTEINTLIDSFDDMTHKLFNTQDKLEKSRNKLNNIFDTMPSALIFVTQDTVIQGWNKYIVEETGIAPNNAIGHPIATIYPAFKNYINYIQKAINDNKEQHIKNAKLILKPDDASRLFNIAVYPMLADNSAEAVIRIDDVTAQVTSDADLAQVEKLASVGASIAGVAHEINNPLGSIMQGTQNVLRRLDPNLESNIKTATELNIDLAQQYKYLEQREIIKFLHGIHESGDRASSIVKNMLKFTRRSTTEMTKANLVDLIKDGLQLASTDVSLQERTDFSQLQIVTNYCAENVTIECCPMEIQQVILNLLKNAAQALETKATDRIITISLTQVANDKICLVIADNGSGIPAEILNKIFQPFFTTKPIGQGTGLGLSVCKNIIVQKHHGTMEVESTVGVGTKFIITLPISN